MQEQIINGFRLSPQQKRLWLLQEDSQAYRCQFAVHIEGELKPKHLKAALENIVTKHEILRTTFSCLPGTTIPLQVINDSPLPPVRDYDLSHLPVQEQKSKIDDLFEEATWQPFDLAKGPILHISLIRMSSYEQMLMVSLPALCADMDTINKIIHEISHTCAASLLGQEPDDALQYADISEWLNELLEADDTETGRAYWRKQNFSALSTLKIPFEKQQAGKARFETESLTLLIPPETTAKIETMIMAQEYDTSLSGFLLTCWQVLLWRLSGQSDMVVGTVVDGRKYEELKELPGLFAKYLPIHCNLKPSIRFREVIESINESLNEVDKWQEYFNWEQISESSPETPFFPFIFDFFDQPARLSIADSSLSDRSNLSFSIYKQYACLEPFKVRLSAVRRDESLSLDFHYNPISFNSDHIRILSEQYQTLLENVLNNPETAISELEILSESERQRLLVQFNETKTDYPEDKCLHQLFSEQVEQTPNNIAVVFEEQYLTYRQLNARANQLAHHLISLGVGPEVMVGIYMERELSMLIGLLGILKAGGAYVPLDPTYPKERTRFMLEDAQVPVLLTQQELVESLPQQKAGYEIICLDTDWQVIAQESKENPINRATPENLAYVIYTSGSTGKPKGTMIVHQGVVNYLSWCTKTYAVADGCGAPVQSSIGFDATITSLFSPLLVGGKVVLLPEKHEIEALSAVLRSKSNFSLVKITPAHLEMLNQLLPGEEARGQARALVIGGEALKGKSLSFWQTHAPNTRLINEYGPTETVVGCCVYEVPAPIAGGVPIGRPIANTQLYILDHSLQPVAIGVPGELHIGGAGVARGYLNRPELTASKFIPNPFGPAARLYKTGDLARYLPDGKIEFLGRIDNQVKIRGFRIELSEIEVVLSQHPAVREAVVIVREDQPGDKRLVAVVVPREEGSNGTQNPVLPEAQSRLMHSTNGSAGFASVLREYLAERLPDYMVPSAFVSLEALPVTPNGKVNRRALQEGAAPNNSSENFVAPRTPTEESLAAIYADILAVEQVGIYDNFFRLGGHSLLATLVISRLREAFSVELPLHSLFEKPTVASLAEHLDQIRWTVQQLQAPSSTIVNEREEIEF